jgi:flagellar biogenesis protein FliO
MVFLGFLIVFFILAIWLLPKLWRGLSRVRAAIRELFGRPAAGTP